VLHPFDSLMQLAAEDIRLDCAALHLSRDVFPHLDLRRCLEQLDGMAAEVAARRPGLSAPMRYEALRGVLVEEHGFTGNKDNYYDADNCYLNRVLERKVGVPIALSIVWLEVGRRLHWPMHGVGFPGHFMVRIDDPDRFILVDPFHEAQTMSIEDCEALLKRKFAGKLEFSADMLGPVDVRAILLRTLGNLRTIYAGTHSWRRLDDVLRRLAAVDPQNATYRQELAALRYRLNDTRLARSDANGDTRLLADAEEFERDRLPLDRTEGVLASLN
jgi:regulator of sirC expression with transglutaminase-like and TPR domain